MSKKNRNQTAKQAEVNWAGIGIAKRVQNKTKTPNERIQFAIVNTGYKQTSGGLGKNEVKSRKKCQRMEKSQGIKIKQM